MRIVEFPSGEMQEMQKEKADEIIEQLEVRFTTVRPDILPLPSRHTTDTARIIKRSITVALGRQFHRFA